MKVWVHGLDFHVQVHTIFDTHDFAFEIPKEKKESTLPILKKPLSDLAQSFAARLPSS